MSETLALVLALALLLLLAALLPRRLLFRAQDRLARQRIEREGASRFRLLTRADLVAGRYRRLPGVLGLSHDRVTFEGLFGESADLATARIRKIETGRRLRSGRALLRLEVLRITPLSGEPLEFVLSRASAFAWRSHLGLWAVKERQADADRVTPGRR